MTKYLNVFNAQNTVLGFVYCIRLSTHVSAFMKIHKPSLVSSMGI